VSRILVAEDEPRLSEFLEKGLRSSGFATTVVADGTAATLLARQHDFDLMILDLRLPGKDGLTVLRELRGAGSRIPVIILTALDDVTDKVAGLEGGADDYMTKPFRFEELLARIRTRLRDSGTSQPQMLRAGEVTLDLRTRWASVGGHPVGLSTREFALLETFLTYPNQVLSREQLLSQVWGYDFQPGSNVVDVYVGYLRKKLGAELIETVHGVGYRFRAGGGGA